MNFLQLCQRVFQEGGISGSITSVTNQTGEAQRVVNWVNAAYQQILNDQSMNWNFQHSVSTIQLTPGIGTYSFTDLGIPAGAQWDINSMRVAKSSTLADETMLAPMRFPEFRDFWLFSANRLVQSRPLNCTVNNQTELQLAPIPDQAYYLNFEWLLQLSSLVANTDVPAIPARFQLVIVWRALREYGLFEAAPEVIARAERNYKEVMLQLELDQSYEVVVAGALC